MMSDLPPVRCMTGGSPTKAKGSEEGRLPLPVLLDAVTFIDVQLSWNRIRRVADALSTTALAVKLISSILMSPASQPRDARVTPLPLLRGDLGRYTWGPAEIHVNRPRPGRVVSWRRQSAKASGAAVRILRSIGVDAKLGYDVSFP